MEAKPVLLGPFFTPGASPVSVSGRIVPLNLTMEWSSATTLTKVHLFLNRLPYAPTRIRLDQVVFRRHELPCDMECQAYQVIPAADGPFLPMEALLSAMYRDGQISRPIFRVLDELAAILPLQTNVSNPLRATGLLVQKAESHGFRLNAVFSDSGRLYAQIAWESEHESTRFHVGAAQFVPSAGGGLDAGGWVTQLQSGVSEVLANELQRTVPRSPAELLTDTGLNLVTNALQQVTERAAPRD